MRAAVRTVVLGKRWTPLKLGASLLGYFDAESALSVPQSAGAVTTWTDPVTGYAPTQGTAANRPVWSPTSFGGRPGITFDGTNDCLAGTSSPYPIGALAGGVEFWCLVSQDALVADTTGRGIIGYGNAGASLGLFGYRKVLSGVNRATAERPAIDGDNTSVDFSGIHMCRFWFTGTTFGCDVDGRAGTPTSGGGALANDQFRIGCFSADVLFWKGAQNSHWITTTTTADQQALLWRFGRSRGTP